jgi:predicted deacylase
MIEHSVEWIQVSRLASGQAVSLAMHRLRGQQAGPTLGVVGAIHGDELVGIEVIRRLIEVLEHDSFCGTVLCLPVANPLAFEALSRNTPLAVEVGNLNRVFPGDPNGDLVAMLAHAIATQFLNEVTHLVDLHAGGTHPSVDYTISLKNLDAARAFGQRVVRPVEGYHGTLGALAAAQGKTSLVAEIGGGYLRDEAYVEVGLRGVLNVLAYLKMVDRAIDRPAEQVVVPTVATLRPHHGGLLYSAVGPELLGEIVGKDYLLGRVISPYTFQTVEEFKAPYLRNIILLVRTQVSRVNPGDYAYMLGDMERAQTLKGG